MQATHWQGGEFLKHLIRLAYARHLPLKGKAVQKGAKPLVGAEFENGRSISFRPKSAKRDWLAELIHAREACR